jgi:hypothetical protein
VPPKNCATALRIATELVRSARAIRFASDYGSHPVGCDRLVHLPSFPRRRGRRSTETRPGARDAWHFVDLVAFWLVLATIATVVWLSWNEW